MKALNLSKLAMAAAMVFGIPAMAQQAPMSVAQQADSTVAQQSPTNAAVQPAPSAAETKRVIVVSLQDHKLALIEDGQVKKIYSVAVGKPSTPSPVGTFTIERRAANPTYHHNGKTIAPGPHNPVGTRWMGLSIRGYGIHGTNEPNSIGKAASHGCIRMGRADLEEFYGMVAVGDTVELIGERNEETAQLFGDPVQPATVQPVQTIAAAPEAPAPSQTVQPQAVRVLMASR
jgi:lipoprotein-anchoring transpeptidase ErfK/SrfK